MFDVRVYVVCGIALAAAGCGGSSDKSTTAVPGNYTAKVSTADLDKQGVITVDIGGGGIWTLKLGAKDLTAKGPLANNPAVHYKIVSSTKGRLTLAGNPECSVHSARTQKTVFTVASKDGGIAFTPVKIACKEDGGVFSAGVWKKA